MFVGWSSEDRGAQLRDVELLVMGYGHAVWRHGIDDPGATFLARFGSYLHKEYGWSASRGPVAAVRDNTSTDEEAWKRFWELVHEFVDRA